KHYTMKRAIFPGSFDPVTVGHYDIVERSLPLFDEIIIALGINASKKYMFSLDERKAFLEQTFANEPQVKVKTYSGLTVDFCIQEKAGFILRGLRNPTDFDFEKGIAQGYRQLGGVETVFLLASSEKGYISST